MEHELGFFEETPPDGTFNKFPPNREAIEGKPLEVCDTPLRNLLPRVPGAGIATKWKQRGTFGERIQTCGYKLLGAFGALRGFSIASGQNYKDLLGHEKQNTLLTVMQNEENALINADSTSTQAPWGNGDNCLIYNGLLNEITVENGVPAVNICENVGELTTAHIDEQLGRCWQNGGRGLFILWGAQEGQSLWELMVCTNTVYRKVVDEPESDNSVCEHKISFIQSTINGERVPVLCSRFIPAGTILFGALYGPEGKPSIDVDVLPQLPGDYDNGIQGYCCTELARSTDAPDVFPFLVSVYEVLRVHDLMCFAKSTGVLPVKSEPRDDWNLNWTDETPLGKPLTAEQFMAHLNETHYVPSEMNRAIRLPDDDGTVPIWFYDALDQQWHRVTSETDTTFTFDRNGQEKTIDKAAEFMFSRSEDRPMEVPKDEHKFLV